MLVFVVLGDLKSSLRTRTFMWESRADVVIVLGAPLENDQPGRLLMSRLELAVDLRKRKTAPVMILCGAPTQDSRVSEAQAMAKWLVAHGVPEMALRLEEGSRNTYENIANAKHIMDISAFSTAIVCTNSFHMMRALYACRRVGLTARAASARAPSLKLHLFGLAYEIGAWIKLILRMR